MPQNIGPTAHDGNGTESAVRTMFQKRFGGSTLDHLARRKQRGVFLRLPYGQLAMIRQRLDQHEWKRRPDEFVLACVLARMSFDMATTGKFDSCTTSLGWRVGLDRTRVSRCLIALERIGMIQKVGEIRTGQGKPIKVWELTEVAADSTQGGFAEIPFGLERTIPAGMAWFVFGATYAAECARIAATHDDHPASPISNHLEIESVEPDQVCRKLWSKFDSLHHQRRKDLRRRVRRGMDQLVDAKLGTLHRFGGHTFFKIAHDDETLLIHAVERFTPDVWASWFAKPTRQPKTRAKATGAGGCVDQSRKVAAHDR